MPTTIPRDIRDDVQRMREALRAVVRTSLLSESQIEQAAGLDEGALKVLWTGRAELRVAQVFRVLRATETEPWRFFLELRVAEGREGQHDAA